MMEVADLDSDGFIDLNEFSVLMEAIEKNNSPGDSKTNTMENWAKLSGVADVNGSIEMMGELLRPVHDAVLKNTPAVMVGYGFRKEQSIVVRYASGMTRFYGDYVSFMLIFGLLWSAGNGLNSSVACLFSYIHPGNQSRADDSGTAVALTIMVCLVLLPLVVLAKLAARSQSLGCFFMGLQVMNEDHQPCGLWVFVECRPVYLQLQPHFRPPLACGKVVLRRCLRRG